MRGPPIAAAVTSVSQASRGTFGMLSQSLSGNKNSKDGFTIVWAGYVTSFQGSAGSEYAQVKSLGDRGARAGDWCFMYTGIGNGVNSSGGVQGDVTTGWTSGNYTWMYDAAYSYKTLNQIDVTDRNILRLCRATYPMFMVIIRANFAAQTIGTLKSSFPNQSSGASLTFPGITKAKDSRGLFSVVCDRDPTSTWGAPAGWNSYNYNNASPFAISAVDLRNPSFYLDGTTIVVPIGGGQTYDQTGMLFELTSGY